MTKPKMVTWLSMQIAWHEETRHTVMLSPYDTILTQKSKTLNENGIENKRRKSRILLGIFKDCRGMYVIRHIMYRRAIPELSPSTSSLNRNIKINHDVEWLIFLCTPSLNTVSYLRNESKWNLVEESATCTYSVNVMFKIKLIPSSRKAACSF